ncbi:hypothetical protein Tco_1054206 [Tanacetum coccineum]|uniref:Uncharacterized protein n=1 Tax=Tanacetum coccineum TaxID=301880 RepID=A0ABQ5GX07_9ASTR
MGNVKKSVAERTRHQRQYDRRVNKRQMQTQESKIDTGKTVDDELVITERSGTKSKVQDDNSRSENDTDADDGNIKPIYDEEPLAEVKLTAECNIFATGQQHTEQPEIINKGRVDQYTEQCQVKSPMLDSSFDNQTTEYSKQSLESENILLKTTVAQFQKDFSRMEAHWEPVLPSLRNQSVVRQPNAFKSERAQMSKQRFASQVDVNKILSKPVTQLILPKNTEICLYKKPDHMIMKLGKKTQERDRNLKTSVMPSARFQSTADGSKPKPRSNNQTSRSLPVSKRKLFDSCTSKVDSEPPHGSNVDIPNIHECKQTLDSMAAEKADISETIVKVDSQMMIQKNDV